MKIIVFNKQQLQQQLHKQRLLKLNVNVQLRELQQRLLLPVLLVLTSLAASSIVVHSHGISIDRWTTLFRR